MVHVLYWTVLPRVWLSLIYLGKTVSYTDPSCVWNCLRIKTLKVGQKIRFYTWIQSLSRQCDRSLTHMSLFLRGTLHTGMTLYRATYSSSLCQYTEFLHTKPRAVFHGRVWKAKLDRPHLGHKRVPPITTTMNVYSHNSSSSSSALPIFFKLKFVPSFLGAYPVCPINILKIGS